MKGIFPLKYIPKNTIICEVLRFNERNFNGRIYSICKSQVLEQLCNNLGISIDESIAVGDGRVDIGMIKIAGLGIAFNALDEVKNHADIVTNDLGTILKYI